MPALTDRPSVVTRSLRPGLPEGVWLPWRWDARVGRGQGDSSSSICPPMLGVVVLVA